MKLRIHLNTGLTKNNIIASCVNLNTNTIVIIGIRYKNIHERFISAHRSIQSESRVPNDNTRYVLTFGTRQMKN